MALSISSVVAALSLLWFAFPFQHPASSNEPALLYVTGYPPANLELEAGKFLIASNLLGDPRFMQTVVLLIRYDRSGSMGLIINHPTDITLSEAFPDLATGKKGSDLVFIGGPVGISRMFLLLRTRTQPDESLHVFGNGYFSISKAVLEDRMKNPAAQEKLRAYAGYSGWAPGQLEAEIQAGHWLVWHGDPEMIFEHDPTEVWKEMIRRSSLLQAGLYH